LFNPGLLDDVVRGVGHREFMHEAQKKGPRLIRGPVAAGVHPPGLLYFQLLAPPQLLSLDDLGATSAVQWSRLYDGLRSLLSTFGAISARGLPFREFPFSLMDLFAKLQQLPE
jgi:hypothetical protein